MAYGVVACRCLLLAVFLVSAISKVHSRSAFAEFVASLRSMRLPATRWHPLLARLVVGCEFAVPVGLLLPRGGLVVYPLVIALMACFSLAIVRAVRLGAAVSCRCFGASDTPLRYRHVLRNALIGAASVLGLVLELAPSWHRLAPTGIALGALTGLVVALLIIRFDDLALLFD